MESNIIEQTELTQRVCRILEMLKLPNSPLEPVESFSHSVWLTQEHVVHYHVIGPVGRLEHEARVAEKLPPDALYPEVVAVGRDGAHDWLVTKRVTGVSLCTVWPYLTPPDRRDAIHQAANALKAIHSSPTRHIIPPCLQGGTPVLSRQDLRHRLHKMEKFPVIETLIKNDISPSVMAHGDFNFNQILWHEGKVTALVDIEMSHAEAPDWDIASFLGFCNDPVRSVPKHLEPISKVEEYREAPIWLEEAYPDMFKFPQLRNRLALHSLVLRFQEVENDFNRLQEIVHDAVEEANKLTELLKES